MPMFDIEGYFRTVYSPKNEELNNFFSFLEKYYEKFGGNRFFDDLIDEYEDLDYKLTEVKENE